MLMILKGNDTHRKTKDIVIHWSSKVTRRNTIYIIFDAKLSYIIDEFSYQNFEILITRYDSLVYIVNNFIKITSGLEELHVIPPNLFK